jgi:hypothetical protein
MKNLGKLLLGLVLLSSTVVGVTDEEWLREADIRSSLYVDPRTSPRQTYTFGRILAKYAEGDEEFSDSTSTSLGARPCAIASLLLSLEIIKPDGNSYRSPQLYGRLQAAIGQEITKQFMQNMSALLGLFTEGERQ